MRQVAVRAFTAKADTRLAVLVTDAHICEAFDPQTTPSPPASALKKYRAIWDTGATNTVITQNVVDECGLKPIGMLKVHTASGESTTLAYLIGIILPNSVGFNNVRVSLGSIAGGADILIGMDIINTGDFAVTNKDGKTAFSFRVPSVECIDFVQQAPSTSLSQASSKVSRNAPCPCGSGKKYKRCCGKSS